MISVENITLLLIMDEDETSWVMSQHPSVVPGHDVEMGL